MKQPSPAASTAVAASLSPKKMGKFSLFSHLKYEHMVAGISGKVQSLITRRRVLNESLFADEQEESRQR